MNRNVRLRYVSFPLTPGSISCLVSGLTPSSVKVSRSPLFRSCPCVTALTTSVIPWRWDLVANLTPWPPLEWMEWGNRPTWARFAVDLSNYCTIKIMLQSWSTWLQDLRMHTWGVYNNGIAVGTCMIEKRTSMSVPISVSKSLILRIEIKADHFIVYLENSFTLILNPFKIWFERWSG